jgi:alpha-glucosidase
MQWTAGPSAGFSSNPDTWLPIAANYKTVNVETESADPDSLLNWYKRLIALRRQNAALRDGVMKMIDCDDPDVLAYLRQTQDRSSTVVVAINMSARAKTVALNSKELGISSTRVRTLAATDTSPQSVTNLKSVTLPPFSSWVGEVRQGTDASNR